LVAIETVSELGFETLARESSVLLVEFNADSLASLQGGGLQR
jgi:hypothetical protein